MHLITSALIVSVVILSSLTTLSHSGVPLSRYEQLKHNKNTVETQNQGLYDANDKVISLSVNNLEAKIHKRKYATLLEYYNSFCGHCRRFAPKYKQLADEIWPWREIVKVMAIDCAADENNDICREYEIMAYPTLRYFPPSYEKVKDNIGYSVDTQDLDMIKEYLVRHVMNETTKVNNSFWPNFESLLDSNRNHLFDGQPDSVQYIIVIYESENSTLAGEMSLQFSRVPAIKIRRITSPNVATTYGISKHTDIGIFDRNSNEEILSVISADREHLRNEIQKFLTKNNLHASSSSSSLEDNPDNKLITNNDDKQQEETEEERMKIREIIEEVKKQQPTIYQADLENALRYTIFHEIPRYAEITGERLLALQRYVNVLKRYNPLGEKGQKFLKDLEDYVMVHNQEIKGEDIEKKLKSLDTQYSDIFSSSRWIGCQASKRSLRGFTCGLWQLFHFMTIQAAENDKSSDPLEVLQAMHGYVKYFFGCSECSKHFQEMAARRKIWNTPSKDNAVLWLWAAHNEVNQRLAGDETEDPEFPKIQFPSKEYCSECYRDSSSNPSSSSSSSGVINEINWNKTEVLNFLKGIYGPQNISRYGVDNENVLPPQVEKLRQKRMVGNVFSDIDMRMGILLYFFCIGMMMVAVKLFLYRGYRKKIYAHDFLGKV